MSAVRKWYPHYVRDFKAKTSHLSLAERGAYRALMDEYWERQGPLPACDKTLCRIIVAFPDEWAEIKGNVLSFFEEREGRLYHARIDEEITKAQSQHGAKVQRMAAARLNRWPDDQQIIDQESDQITEQISDTPLPSPLPKNQEPRGARKRASRLEENWKLPEDWKAYALDGGLTGDEAELLAHEMLGWSLTKPQGTSLDWKRTFQTWCRKHRSWGMVKTPQGSPTVRVPDHPDPDCAEKWNALRGAIGEASLRSWFLTDGVPTLRKNCAGFIIAESSPLRVDRIKQQFAPALTRIFGKGQWRIEPPP